ncbi:DUF4142 domain-containing protein [Sphingobacterium sp. lm-10]|uniref:DUF4142 domain-containing protein n=1 Tax=Sphingobacterium sp. lm-10 TaxID=2944904 RepID=UPI0020207376|nr:DUF4142 domain-containing protein [Sphingobacterium sp. lm-10]MCL7987118.1 DUF4142 domain-containing protein [Sphingobacterium sp. lm-10]
MKNLIYPLAFSAALFFQACNNNANKTTDHADSTNLITGDAMPSPGSMQGTTADTTFTNKAAIGGMAEVELSKLATEKSSNAKIKDFASQMVKDHTKVNDELKAIAENKNIMLPTSLDAEHAKVKKDLEGKQGAEFDKAYVKAMVDGHKKTHSLMEDGAKNNLDAELKAFAAKTEPVVKHHLEMVQQLESDMK